MNKSAFESTTNRDPRRLFILIALTGLLVRSLIAGTGFFYWDDLILISRSNRLGALSLDYILANHDGHLMPAASLLIAAVNQIAPLTWWPVATALIVLNAFAIGTVAYMVWKLAAASYASCIALALYVFSPLVLPGATWWAAAVNALPLHIAWALAVIGVVNLMKAVNTNTPTWPHLVVVTASFTFGLLFFEKSILLVPLLIVYVAMCTHLQPPHPLSACTISTRWSTQLGALQPLWIALGAISASWATLYIYVLSRPLPAALPEDTTTTVSLTDRAHIAWESLLHGALPALGGGPVSWDRWPPGPPWAEPPLFISVLTILLIALALYLVTHTTRLALWPLALLAFFLALDVLLLALVRTGPNTSGIIGQTLRHFVEIPLALAALVPLIHALARQDNGSSKKVLTAVVSLVTILSVVSSIGYFQQWTKNPTRAYVVGVHRLATAPKYAEVFPLLDQPTDTSVLLPFAHPDHMLSTITAGIADTELFAHHTHSALFVGQRGTVQPAEFVALRWMDKTPLTDCGYSLARTQPVTVSLDGPLIEAEWIVQVNYLVQQPTDIKVAISGYPAEVLPLRAGANTAYIRVVGSGNTLEFSTQDAARVCIGRGGVGGFVPHE